MPSEDLIGVGWDVRGWQSTQQAIAVARLRPSSRTVEWLGISKPFSIPNVSRAGLRTLIDPALSDKDRDLVLSSRRSVLAIDAPLSFPETFRRLVNRESVAFSVPEKEIENPLAYRYCERWVYSRFGKKALSGPFDKLGNNATLAISVSRLLAKEGFELVPQDTPSSTKAIIEVYPALVKAGKKKLNAAVEKIDRHLPDSLSKGTDQYDAAICALLALAYQGAGPDLGLPGLTPPPPEADPNEGWIYAFPPELIGVT